MNYDYNKFFCCEDMTCHIYLLDQKLILDEGDVEDKIIYYKSKYNEYGIPLYDESFITIEYCPWCGRKLPKSKRDEWFEKMEEMGIEEPLEGNYPEEYKTWNWWKNKTK